MSSFLESSLFNETLLETIIHHASETGAFLWDFVNSGATSAESFPKITPVLSVYDQITDVLHFDEFQLLLLKTFSLMLVVTLLLILISWKVYGKRISERFMKPATSRAIEELKESVSKLKLPKEHTPRI